MAVATLAALAACSGTDPDPGAIARTLPAARTTAAADEPVVAVTASWLPHAAALPAPLAEPAPPAHRRGVAASESAPSRLLLGPHADGTLDAEARAALAAAADCVPVALDRGNDRDAIERLLQGHGELALVTSKLSARDQRAGLQQTRLGVELWAIALATDAAPRSLTAAQMRKVLTGELRSWNDLGHSGGAITVLVPADRAAAQRAAKALIPGDPFAEACVAVGDAELAVRLREPGALAVVRVAAAPIADARLLSIDWSVPGHDTFVFGTYPYGHAVSLVTLGQPSGDALALLQLARSPAGQALLGRTLLLQR